MQWWKVYLRKNMRPQSSTQASDDRIYHIQKEPEVRLVYSESTWALSKHIITLLAASTQPGKNESY